MSLIPEIFSYKVKEILENASWRYYSKTPTVVIFSEENDYYNPDEVIMLYDQSGSIEETFDNSDIVFNQGLEIKAKDTTMADLRNMATDIIRALQDAVIPYVVRTFTIIPDKDRYKMTLFIERIA